MRFIRIPALAVCIVLIASTVALGQKRTEETITTTDSTGNTTTKKVVRVSETDDITPRNNVVLVNPLKFFLFYNLSYFHAVSPNMAIGGGFQIPALSGFSGFGINLETRFHPSGKALRGFYVAPNLSYNSLSISDVSGDVFTIGVLAGWQWFPGDDFAIGLGIGADRYFVSVGRDNDVSSFDDYEGTFPAVRFDIGYGW